MNHSTITIIGAGNMGASLLGGLIATGVPANQLWITDPDENKLQHLKEMFHINTTTDNIKAVQLADAVIFAVKPQVFSSVIQSIAETLCARQTLIISIAAGIRVAAIQQWLGNTTMPVIRCMPNTPALIRAGASALYANAHVSNQQRELAESILRAVGIIVWLDDEKLMDAVTAISGSGPAYFFLFIEIMQSAGEKLGLSADTARLLTLQTAYGAARMALENDESAAELRHKVTSPGGTTEAAIRSLESSGIRKLFTDALLAANHRSEELGRS